VLDHLMAPAALTIARQGNPRGIPLRAFHAAEMQRIIDFGAEAFRLGG
jgi:hypothetical protein